jgi:tetratricopeptide (TPR) repeat protein
MGNMKMIRDKRYFKLLIGMSIITGIMSGCASSHGQLQIKSNYKNLIDQQMATVSGDATDPKAFPEMTSDDRERLGDVNVSRGSLQMAFVQYQKSLKLNPDNTRVKYKKGMVFVLGGLNEDAVQAFRQILKENPEHSLTHEGLGLAFYQMKEYEDAEKHFRIAIELDATLWKAHNMLGVTPLQ